jgi:arylsulfatase A-like enzyme
MTNYTTTLKSCFVFAGILLAIQCGLCQNKNQRPNVIVILSDDQGYGDFSCHGNPVVRTPALDKLHDESIRFTNFHVTPLCTPTRGELMSGLDAFTNKAQTVGSGRNIMRRDIVTMPEVFAYNKYETGIFGKWHLGDNYPDRPMDRGFKKSLWVKGWGLLSEAEFDNDYYKTRYLDGTQTKYSDKYCTDLWFDEAMKWMEEMADEKKPFFTYLATNTPHGPFQAPEGDFNYFKSKGYDEKTSNFLGMIENIDNNMARLEKWLVTKKLKENTLVIFMTDNGTAAGADVFNAGMRGMKGSNYDGGHRGACFIRWPSGGFETSRSVAYPSQIQDILPTFIDLFSLKLPKKNQFDGKSLKPALLDKKQELPDRMFIVQYSEKNGPEKYFNSVVWNSWRLVGANELYDLTNDPGQKVNVVKQHPDIFKKMNDFYGSWWKQKELSLKKFVPVLVGSEKENPMTLTSDYWMDSSYVNTQWAVAQAGGPSNGGEWNIFVEQGGKYKLELSRWPFHINRSLRSIGPDTAIGGTKIRKGVAVPIAFGCVSLNSAVPVIVKEDDKAATNIAIEVNIPAGENRLRAWFQSAAGKDLCGAYYLRIKRMGIGNKD